MVILPGFMFCFALLKACLGSEQTTVAPQFGAGTTACPGRCVQEESCSAVLNDTDCDGTLVCCVDEETLNNMEYEGYSSFHPLGSSPPAPDEYEEVEAEVEEQVDDQTVSYSIAEEGADEENPDYTYVFSEESDAFTVGRSGEVALSCPGECVPRESSHECQYILANEEVCPPETTCCVTEDAIEATSDLYNYYATDDETVQVKRDERSPSDDSCPGTCVHPSHALFCEQILPEFSCPLDSKCCIKRSSQRSSKTVQCTGQCLPWNMHGYCFYPNELIVESTTCEHGTTCCMQKSREIRAQPPSIGTMQFPSVQYTAPTDPSQVVLGHLAVDDEGTVFKVGTDGQISPLPTLARIDHLRATYNKLMVYPRAGGHIVIYSDSTGALYQQFYPNDTYDPETPFGKSSSKSGKVKPGLPKSMFKPAIRRPTEEESSLQDFEIMPEFLPQGHSMKKPVDTEREMSLQDFDSSFPEELDDIIIPDDEDEAPVMDSKPSVADTESGKPTCPGACMPYFLRFTCFRGHAIYSEFFCSGRSVCCARVADIESHEKRLRSLSPYNKESSDFGKTVPKCGIKGRKDSQRTVGAKDSLPGEWCWQVAVINVQNQYMCGGALIGESWVLTAAQCVVGSMKENQAIFVRAGVTDLKSMEDNNKGQTVKVGSIYIHEGFNSMNLDNNIALLKLQRPVASNDNVCVVCLPTSGQMPAGNAKCTVTGYGFVSKEGDMSLRIREAAVTIVDDTECMANVTEALVNPFLLPASSFCAGGQGQEDCQGDAGGPLVCEISGHHELVGLVSWTLGCGRNDVPSIYVKVPAFMGWVNKVIGSSMFLTSLN